MTYEELAQELVNALAQGQDALWVAGDLLSSVEVPATAFASVCGRSGSFLNRLRKTSRAFPEHTRAQDQPWTLHEYASRAKDPEKWLAQSLAEGWSPKQLMAALRDSGEVATPKGRTCPRCGEEI